MPTSRIKHSALLGASIIVGVSGLVSSQTTLAATVFWSFDRPSTVAQTTAPYPSVALLKLEDTADGVVFTLDPNEVNNGGFQTPPPDGQWSTVDDLSFVFNDTTTGLTATDVVNLGGAAQNSVVVDITDSEVESGYTNDSSTGVIQLIWQQPTGKFDVNLTSVWRINGTTIADNFSALATANSGKPSPIFGVISVSPFTNAPDETPNPSNWVTGPAPVPLPAAVWLFGSALLGVMGIGYRRRRVADAA